jgi:hypothetical protein
MAGGDGSVEGGGRVIRGCIGRSRERDVFDALVFGVLVVYSNSKVLSLLSPPAITQTGLKDLALVLCCSS